MITVAEVLDLTAVMVSDRVAQQPEWFPRAARFSSADPVDSYVTDQIAERHSDPRRLNRPSR